MSTAREDLLSRHIEAGTVPGAVALLGSSDVEVVAAGVASIGGRPMRDDAIMRIQSMTKAVTSVAALRLVEAGRLGLDESLDEWVPELADRRVLSSPTAELDDTMPADRAITLRHLLTNASGYGMAIVESPLQRAMLENSTEAGPEPPTLDAEEWPTGRTAVRIPTRRRLALSRLLRAARHLDRTADGPSTGCLRRTDTATTASLRPNPPAAVFMRGRRPSRSATANSYLPDATSTASPGCSRTGNRSRGSR